MKNMRRLIAVMLLLTMALCLVACGETENSTPATTTQSAPAPTTQSTPAPTTTNTTVPATPSFVILVVDQDGNPVANVPVQLCDDSNCYGPFGTNADGIVEFYGLDGVNEPHARIYANKNNQPAGLPDYQVDKMEGSDEDGYLYFAEGQTTMTLTVTKVAG